MKTRVIQNDAEEPPHDGRATPAGEPRRSSVSSIQIMSPCAPAASHCRRRSAVFGAASARATPSAEKPASRAISSSDSRSFDLPSNTYFALPFYLTGGSQIFCECCFSH